jgi:AcrR family transcriptional regulator
LDATEHLLLDSGDEAITIEMIAERVGIAKGTIYKHFQSKDELILQVLIAYETELATVMAEAVKSQDIHQLIQSYFVFRLASPEKHLLFERLENKLAATDVPYAHILRVCTLLEKVIYAKPCLL